MFARCIEASVVLKFLGWKVSEKIGGKNPDFKTLDLPFLYNLKTMQNLRLSSEAKL